MSKSGVSRFGIITGKPYSSVFRYYLKGIETHRAGARGRMTASPATPESHIQCFFISSQEVHEWALHTQIKDSNADCHFPAHICSLLLLISLSVFCMWKSKLPWDRIQSVRANVKQSEQESDAVINHIRAFCWHCPKVFVFASSPEPVHYHASPAPAITMMSATRGGTKMAPSLLQRCCGQWQALNGYSNLRLECIALPLLPLSCMTEEAAAPPALETFTQGASLCG